LFEIFFSHDRKMLLHIEIKYKPIGKAGALVGLEITMLQDQVSSFNNEWPGLHSFYYAMEDADDGSASQ
jgi:hypothetical protein